MKLIVGDQSTWSMRAWLCLKLAGIAFEEKVIPLGVPGYKEELGHYSPSMLVPVLDTGEVKIHDSLAIAEYCNELSGGKLLPTDVNLRAECRSLVCELHSGFTTIRTTCPFSWEPVQLTALTDDQQREIKRLEFIWSEAAGEFYYGTPTMADSFYAVMAYRLASYNITLSGKAGLYQAQLIKWPLFISIVERAKSWPEINNR